jgi:hypothetical protein
MKWVTQCGAALAAVVLVPYLCFGQSNDNPVPEYEGIYATFEGKLVGLDTSASTAVPKKLQIRTWETSQNILLSGTIDTLCPCISLKSTVP